jgi:hypothetical protein
MTQKSWILTDVDEGHYIDTLTVTPEDVGGPASGYRIGKRRLHGGLSDGVDVLEVDNDRMSFVVVPTRGMGIWHASVGDLEVGWNSPIRGPVHPAWVPLMEPSGLGWLDGFDELLVRCGLESNGAPDFDANGQLKYPLHGRIANRPAQQVSLSVDGQSGEIVVRGVVEESRFHFSKLRLTTILRTRVGQPRLEIHDLVENLSGTPAQIQLLYHINFGPPLLQPGSRIVAPVHAVVPRNKRAVQGISSWQVCGPPEPGSEEQVYFCRLAANDEGRTSVLLADPTGHSGASIDFSTSALPCFTLWKNTAPERDGYVTGLEPGTNFPNPRTFEQKQGRLVTLPPEGRASFEVGLAVQTSPDEVSQAEKAITQLQPADEPQVFDAPQPDWCAR